MLILNKFIVMMKWREKEELSTANSEDVPIENYQL
jgi:hypothetical protein